VQNVALFGSPRPVPYSDFRQNSIGTNISTGLGTMLANGAGAYAGGTDNILGSVVNFAGTASVTYVLALNLYSGPVAAHLVNNQTLTTNANLVSAANMTNGGLATSILSQGVIATSGLAAANSFTQLNTTFPRAPVFLVYSQPATAGNFGFAAIGQQAA
jgi:hypothetical protein